MLTVETFLGNRNILDRFDPLYPVPGSIIRSNFHPFLLFVPTVVIAVPSCYAFAQVLRAFVHGGSAVVRVDGMGVGIDMAVADIAAAGIPSASSAVLFVPAPAMAFDLASARVLLQALKRASVERDSIYFLLLDS